MFLNRDVLARAVDPAALFVFFHTQRTGGSNMQRWLQDVFPAAATFSRRTDPAYQQWQFLKDFSLLDGKRLVSGFAEYRRHETGRPMIGLANARHPFYRIASLYGMSRSHEGHFLHEISKDASFEAFYREGARIRPRYFNNVLCARIGGAATAAEAVAVMQRDFGMVACTNRLHEATAALAAALGWPVAPIEPSGAAPDEQHYARYNDSPVRDEILANNQEDLRLFEFVDSGGTVLPPRSLTPAPAPRRAVRDGGSKARRGGGPEGGTPDGGRPDGEAPDAAAAPRLTPAEQDAAYQEFLATNPGASFSTFYTSQVAAKVRQGAQHNSLGTNIVTGKITDFWDSGAKQAQKLIRIGGLLPQHRVVEYGCGSLRVAGHVIRLLEPGHFFGLDIISDFFELGRANVGEALIAEKRPVLAAITPDSVQAAADFAPDFVYSHAVLIHVHPDDVPLYFANLSRIAQRPGTRLAFNAMLHPTPVRYNNLGWAWPQDSIVARLPDFDCIDVKAANRPTIKGEFTLTGATFTFRRR
jgi:SAM-dependent methyltransferase